jgi:hypothetical protein
MKPRIFKEGGLWCCVGLGHVGYGYTPRHAWEEWSKR